MKNKEVKISTIVFNLGKCALIPFYLGLILCIFFLLIKFLVKLYQLGSSLLTISYLDVVTESLTLIDLALVAQLLIIITVCGYAQFVASKESTEYHTHWMFKLKFHSIKLILINSLVAISGIELLKLFLQSEMIDNNEMMWSAIIFGLFSISAPIYAMSERISGKEH